MRCRRRDILLPAVNPTKTVLHSREPYGNGVRLLFYIDSISFYSAQEPQSKSSNRKCIVQYQNLWLWHACIWIKIDLLRCTLSSLISIESLKPFEWHNRITWHAHCVWSVFYRCSRFCNAFGLSRRAKVLTRKHEDLLTACHRWMYWALFVYLRFAIRRNRYKIINTNFYLITHNSGAPFCATTGSPQLTWPFFQEIRWWTIEIVINWCFGHEWHSEDK